MTGAELETMLERDELAFLGAGSRRECHAIPGTSLCLKCYRDETAAPNATVAREIRRYRHDQRRNACCREYRYWQKLKSALPPYVFAAFPDTMEQILLPNRGWAVVETRVQNADGTPCERFSLAYRAADDATKAKLLKEFWLLSGAFAAYAVRFYDTQNIVVQQLGSGDFRLRVVDFEPAARTLIPIDSLCNAIVRGKVIRRAKRYLASHCGVKAKYQGLSPRLRRKWDRLIATDGAKLGLTDCRVFLENKLVNDIFYEGMFKGRPCVVKCSSRAPDSIRNEYEMSRRMFAAAAEVISEPFACHATSDGRMAFAVNEFIPNLKMSDAPATDILQMADALRKTGIVHRDINVNNLLVGRDGHLKLIDFQFAVDRANYRESLYMLQHPTYLFFKFGNCEDLGIGRWNDLMGLGLVACLRHFSPGSEAAERQLMRMIQEMTFSIPVPWTVRLWLWCKYAGLKLRSKLVRHRATTWRCQKLKRLMSEQDTSSAMGPTISEGERTVSFSFSISDNYAQHLTVVIASLLENNPGVPFVFHVLYRSIRPETMARIRRLEGMYLNHRIVFHEIDARAFDRFPIPPTLTHITQEMYYRYLLPELLTDESRTIYSDVDVLCVGGDIRDLWTMDLNGHPIAAIRKDQGNDANYVAHMERMGIPAGSPYYFSGMFVMDLEKLRDEGFTAACMAKTAEKADCLLFPDMDVINAVMKGRFAEIDPRWNVTDRFSFFRRWVFMWHFVGQTQKPWCCIWKNTTWLPYARYLLRTPYWSGIFNLILSHIRGFFYFKYTKNRTTRCLVCGIRVWRRRIPAGGSR